MKFDKKLTWLKLFFLAVPLVFISSVQACTTWAGVGSVNLHSGLLIAKNRGGSHKGLEKLTLITPKKGYKYLTLVYKAASQKTKTYPYMNAGINQKGLVIVNNAASLVPQTPIRRTQVISFTLSFTL